MKNEHFTHVIHSFNLISSAIRLEHAMPLLYLSRPLWTNQMALSNLLIIASSLVAVSLLEIFKNFFEIIHQEVLGKHF